MNKEELRDHAFVIDTLAHLLEHLANNPEAELGDREILHTLIAKELQSRSEKILKT